MQVSLFLLRLGRQITLIKSFNYKLFSVFTVTIEDNELNFQYLKLIYASRYRYLDYQKCINIFLIKTLYSQAGYHFNLSYSNPISIVKITFFKRRCAS